MVRKAHPRVPLRRALPRGKGCGPSLHKRVIYQCPAKRLDWLGWPSCPRAKLTGRPLPSAHHHHGGAFIVSCREWKKLQIHSYATAATKHVFALPPLRVFPPPLRSYPVFDGDAQSSLYGVQCGRYNFRRKLLYLATTTHTHTHLFEPDGTTIVLAGPQGGSNL